MLTYVAPVAKWGALIKCGRVGLAGPERIPFYMRLPRR